MTADSDTLRTAAAQLRDSGDAVTVALAPLLERLAGRADMVTSSVQNPQLAAAVVGSHIVGYVEAVAFARAYLGEEDPT